MSDSPDDKKSNWMNITKFVLLVVAFGGGVLTNWNGFLTNSTTRESQLAQAITQITQVTAEFRNFIDQDFKPFMREYNLSHENTAVAIKDLNTHLEYADRRLDALEQRAKFGK